MFVRNGGTAGSLETSLLHVQATILTEKQAVFQCQLCYELGDVLLCIGRYAEAKLQLEAATTVWKQVGHQSRCQVPEGRLKGLLRAALSALDASTAEVTQQGLDSSLLHSCENLRKLPDSSGLANAILLDSLTTEQQLPQLYCEQLVLEEPEIAAAALMHRLFSRVPTMHLAAGLITVAASTQQGRMCFKQAAPDLRVTPHKVQSRIERLLRTARFCVLIGAEPKQPARTRSKRPALQELLVHTHGARFGLAAQAAAKLGNCVETGCVVTTKHLWSAVSTGLGDFSRSQVFEALVSHDIPNAKLLVTTLTELGDVPAQHWGEFLCGSGTLPQARLIAPHGALMVPVVCKILNNDLSQVAMLQLIAENTAKITQEELALLRQARAIASLLLAFQARESTGWSPVVSAAVELCSESPAHVFGDRFRIRSLQLLLSRCTHPGEVLSTLSSVIGAIVLHHTAEPQWDRFGAVTASISAGLGNYWDQLAQVQDGAAALLSLCLGQLRRAEPDNPSWLVASGEMHLAKNEFPLALRSLLLAEATEDQFFMQQASLLSSGPMLRKLTLCTTALEMHSATLVLCQLCKPPDLVAADKLLSQVPVEYLDESYFGYVWHLPILERLMHICANAGSQSRVNVLLYEFRDPAANQWNHSKLHAVLESAKRDNLIRALFRNMLARTITIDDLR
eukprot:TRINITY_DN931_c0_g1_i27.p1 TRINITY_DN931_c0_g1~~TRINITY_DN931_c0_g1_i27.p1  ORF type:complete len:680 (-),score=123.55 TRINITY_DN931_c0_g1_i27:118-2157(-)